MAHLKVNAFVKNHKLISVMVVTSLIIGAATYGWQYNQQRKLSSENNLLRTKIAQQDRQLHPTSRQPNLKDQDALTRLARADYLANPANKTAPKVKIDKVLGNFALTTVTHGTDSYKIVAKKVADQWVIIGKGDNIAESDRKAFSMPANLFN